MTRRVSSFGRLAPAALAALPLLGCAAQPYEPAPLDGERILAGFEARTPTEDGLRAFMAGHGVATDVWPLRHWDLAALTLAAIYYHPDMEVARARLEVRRAAEVTAGQRPNPGVGPVLEHHSDSEDEPADSPWSIGITLDLPIETSDRRAARLARAEALTEEARLAIAATAWQVRSRVRRRFTDSFAAGRATELLRRRLDAHQREVSLLEKRQALGEASPTEVSIARLGLQEARLALITAEGSIEAARAGLAEALGMPLETVRDLDISFDALADRDPRSLAPEGLERTAFRNRLDVRQAEARYAGAEAALREEIAKQYPDLRLSPGFLWDQGDVVKSIGAALLVPVLHLNDGPIAEARARRSLEAARFSALQAQVTGEINGATARLHAAVRAWETARDLVETQRARLEHTQKLFTHGEIDRLTLVRAEIELVAAERARLAARIDAFHALAAVEDAVQRPLDGSAVLPQEADLPSKAAAGAGGMGPGR